jgi:VIT1/CCC1 family predicted Fe2+/Mn2+ transporter
VIEQTSQDVLHGEHADRSLTVDDHEPMGPGRDQAPGREIELFSRMRDERWGRHDVARRPRLIDAIGQTTNDIGGRDDASKVAFLVQHGDGAVEAAVEDLQNLCHRRARLHGHRGRGHAVADSNHGDVLRLSRQQGAGRAISGPRRKVCSAGGMEEEEGEQRRHHDRVDPHFRGRWLSDLILGAQDGLVNTLGVVLGVAAASDSARITFAAGLAAAIAEAVSMGAVAYTSSAAMGELYRSEREREYRHITRAPTVEREEIRALYAKKGFEGDLLERVVETICANPDVWVEVMMAEEHGLTPVSRRSSLRAAAVVGFASLAGAVLPVLPFVRLARTPASMVSLALGAAGLFALGAIEGRVTTRRPARSGVSLMLIGLVSASVGYVVGALAAP